MPNASLLIIIFGTVILIWQLILSFFVFKILNRYNKLAKLESEELERNLVATLGKRINDLEKNELDHIQKVKVVRFNPFNETGGDNSFTLGLLNAKMDGIILTGLHTREKTRMYVKEIRNGKSNYELSSEELRLLKNA